MLLQSTIKLKAMNGKMMNWHIMTFLLVIIGRLLLNVMKFFDFFFVFSDYRGGTAIKEKKYFLLISVSFKTPTWSSKFAFPFVHTTISIFPAYLKLNLPRIIVCENRRASKTFSTPRINITNQLACGICCKIENLKKSKK